VLVVAGCGGGEREAAPVLPNKLGTALAARADRVAAELRGGNPEGARAQARALQTAVKTAINAGRVPPELAEHLLGAANALAEAIPPPPRPPAEEEKKAEENSEGNGRGKAEGKEKDGDE
jgi:hypothetical protein